MNGSMNNNVAEVMSADLLTSAMSLWNWSMSSFAVMPPSTLSAASFTPLSFSMASSTSSAWNAAASSDARTRCRLPWNAVSPQIVPRASSRPRLVGGEGVDRGAWIGENHLISLTPLNQLNSTPLDSFQLTVRREEPRKSGHEDEALAAALAAGRRERLGLGGVLDEEQLVAEPLD